MVRAWVRLTPLGNDGVTRPQEMIAWDRWHDGMTIGDRRRRHDVARDRRKGDGRGGNGRAQGDKVRHMTEWLLLEVSQI